MADMSSKSRKLSINLSLFTFSETLLKSPIKSPKKFEEPNGVVGLGILAAMNDDESCKDPFSKRASIPVFSNKKSTSFSARRMNAEEMELCEEYTCVISHVGDKQIKKKEYFDYGNGNGNGVFLGSSTDIMIPVPDKIYGGETKKIPVADFLNSCFLCEKQLHGLDIFMYRGEKAFCSAECRNKQIAFDEYKEKRGSGSMKPHEYSASPSPSPCSSPMQFFAGMAAA